MAKRKIPSNTQYFTYYNANPKDKTTGDCVIRAISKAMDKSWDEVFNALCDITKKYKLMPNDRKCYNRYLKDNGWVECSQPRKWDNTKYTGKEFCNYLDETEAGTSVIAHIGSHHIVAIVEDYRNIHKIYDTWNSSSHCIGKYWVK